MDTYVFASLAQVRILLIPVGTIPQSSFEKYAAEIRSFDTISLGDLPENKEDRARFMPKDALSTGHLHLSFTVHVPPSAHQPLSLLRPSHFPLAVIGVAVCTPADSIPSILGQFNASVLDICPPDGLFPLAKNCFIFEEGDESTSVNLGENLPGTVVIPGIMGNKKLYIGTLLADLCSNILGEFGVVYQALESPLGNEYLNASVLPTLPSLSELPASLNNNARGDSLPPLPSHNSQPDMGKSGLTLASHPGMKRVSSSGPNYRQSSLGVPTVKKKRLSGIGAASSHGRLFKVLADFFLLAGRTEDASIWYHESLQLFKSSQDGVWQASALEGLATVAILDAWSAGHGLQGSTSSTQDPWSDVAEKLNQATALYFKSPSTDGDQDFSLLAYLYCTCVLRHSSLLFAIWSAKGWGPLAFTTLLQPGSVPYLPPTLSHDEPTSWSNVERLSSISGISRSSIATVVAQVHGPWLLHLDARERISTLEAMASVYSCIGYRRKEAYILREVLGCILDLVVCGRDEDGLTKMSNGSASAGLGIESLNSGSTLGRGHVGVRLSESTEGNESVLKLLKYVCKVLGINLDAVRLLNAESSPSDTLSDEKVYEDDLMDGYQEPYGWPELQVGVVREAVAVAEALPDFTAVAQFALSSLKTLQLALAPGDQYHLYSTAARALMTAKRRGDSKSVEYWSGRPIVSITVAPLPLIRLPIEKPMSALERRTSDYTPILTGGTDPFLYNPRRAMAEKGHTLVVQNEVLEFIVVLQNPYVFDLELQSLALSTSGVQLESEPIRILIPARSYHRASISGKAVETGSLVIRGCIAQAPGGGAREFILPLATDEEEERFARKRSALECETGRSKYSGLDCFPWEKARKRTSTQITTSNAPLKFLECKVVPEQPMLRIRRTSVTHGALMLYDGEMSTIRITFENVSPLMIDFLRLAFDDSTIAPAQQTLAEGTLSVFDTYETEYDLLHRPMFSWNKDEVKDIPAGQKLTLTVNCFGKVGCTSGTIHVSYSYVHRSPSESKPAPEVFHTRQLSYPLMVTVYHMLECQAMNILPFPASSSELMEGQTTETGRANLLVDDQASWCLFYVDVRNTYGTPFEISIERVQKDVPSAKTSTTVPPGSTSRIVVPLRKILLSEEQLKQAIPTLSDRQFVVTKSKLSAAEQKVQRELFWYREELFKCLRCRWHEAGGSRHGNLSLRQQRMTMPMLETLRTEMARTAMSLVQYDDAASCAEEVEVLHHGGKYYPPANEFVYLRTKVTNLSLHSLVFAVDFGMEPAEQIICEGVLSNVPIGRLEPGETQEVEMALSFLAFGRFEITANVRALDAPGMETTGGAGVLTAVVRAEG